MNIEINHHRVPAIKFRALGTQYPTGKYIEAYIETLQTMSYWFELHIDGIEITWYRVTQHSKGEEE